MAIFSLRHAAIGKTTQRRPHTAAAHIRYITREGAVSQVDAERMPRARSQAIGFMVKAEDGDRANARVMDKVMLALPRELDGPQRAALVRSFAEKVTQGRAPWLAAFHDQGKDAANPHCHLVIRDRDPESGRRVIGMSEVGSTNRLRELWEEYANRALELAGHDERIDRRTLEAQGIERSPTIHEGPNARAMEAKGKQPASKVRDVCNGPKAKSPDRQVDYEAIDGGRGRVAYNQGIRESEEDLWQAVDGAREEEGIEAQRAIHRPDLVDVVSALPLGSQKVAPSDIAIDPGPLVPTEAEPVLPEFLTPGLDVGQAVDEPAADWIVGRETHDDPAQRGAEPIKEGTNDFQYNDRIAQFGFGDKQLSEDIDFYRNEYDTAEKRANLAKGNFDALMQRSYLDPKAAEAKMDEFRAKNGNEALYQKLGESGPGQGFSFGRRPGSMLSRQYLTPEGAENRQDSRIARQSLPAAMRSHHQHQDNLDAKGRAYRDALTRNGQPVPDQLQSRQAQKPTLEQQGYTRTPPESCPRQPKEAAGPAGGNSGVQEPAWKNPAAHGYEKTPDEAIPKERPAQQAAPQRDTQPAGDRPGTNPQASQPAPAPAERPSFSDKLRNQREPQQPAKDEPGRRPSFSQGLRNGPQGAPQAKEPGARQPSFSQAQRDRRPEPSPPMPPVMPIPAGGIPDPAKGGQKPPAPSIPGRRRMGPADGR